MPDNALSVPLAEFLRSKTPAQRSQKFRPGGLIQHRSSQEPRWQMPSEDTSRWSLLAGTGVVRTGDRARRRVVFRRAFAAIERAPTALERRGCRDVEGTTSRLRPGETARYPVDSTHRISNDTATTARPDRDIEYPAGDDSTNAQPGLQYAPLALAVIR